MLTIIHAAPVCAPPNRVLIPQAYGTLLPSLHKLTNGEFGTRRYRTQSLFDIPRSAAPMQPGADTPQHASKLLCALILVVPCAFDPFAAWFWRLLLVWRCHCHHPQALLQTTRLHWQQGTRKHSAKVAALPCVGVHLGIANGAERVNLLDMLLHAHLHHCVADFVPCRCSWQT